MGQEPDHHPDEHSQSRSGNQDQLVSAQQGMEQVRNAFAKIDEQVGQVIVGQKGVIEQMLIALFCRGHAVLVGVPGLAKTLLVSTIARALELQFSRIH